MSKNLCYCRYVIIDIFTFYYILRNSYQSYQLFNAKIRNSNFYSFFKFDSLKFITTNTSLFFEKFNIIDIF